MRELTEKQKAILSYLAEARAQSRGTPTVRELAQLLGVSSTATVHQHLNALITKGYLQRDSYKHRSIELSEKALAMMISRSAADEETENPANLSSGDVGQDNAFTRDVVNVPLVGEIAAGPPLLAQENVTDVMPLPRDLVGNGEVFGLTVRGESMIEAGIFNGDKVIVRRQPNAENGQIVAALIGDEATVKTFYRERGRIRLQPENSTMEPIYCDNPTILGKVVLVIRQM